tara:strand:+ start:29737 stop:31851 length:2115 start_codon:yes stop_codon:yes gene_type:complete
VKSLKKVVVTGGSGLLATNIAWIKSNDWSVCLFINQKSVSIKNVNSVKVDLTCIESVLKALDDFRPEFVINAAGLTSVETCESDFYQGYISNVITAKTVARATNELRIPLVHISTDHFSDSSKPSSTETEIEIPLNNYAKTKLDGEFEVQKANKNSLIIRTNFYANGHSLRRSFSDLVLKNLRQRKEILLFDDVFYSPIIVNDLIDKIEKLVEQKESGVFNIVGPDRLTKYQFGLKLAEKFNLDSSLLKKGSIKDLKHLVQRPLDMSLSPEKAEKALGEKMMSMEESLEILKNDEFVRSEHKDSINVVPMKKMLYYGKQYIDTDDVESVIKTLKSDWLTQGPKVAEFEKRITNLVDAKYAVAMSNWTCGLHMACLALGVGPGDAVITSPLSFVASSNCAVYCGATPLFADIDSETLNIDPEKVEDLLKANSNVKVIIPVHFGGSSCDMQKLAEIARKYNVKIIEDAAHGIGGSHADGSKIGSCKFSDISGFSFHPVKNITSGEGGVITTNDKEIYKQLCRLRSHGINKGNDEFVFKERAFTNGEKNYWYHEMQQVGFNYRITDFQCSLGLSQLSKLQKFFDRRVEIATQYDKAFANLLNGKILQANTRTVSGNHLYVLNVDFKALGLDRYTLFEKFSNEYGIGLHVHYLPIPMNPYYIDTFDIPESSYKNAKDYFDSAITLPLFPGMNDADVENVLNAVREIIG